MKDVTDRFREFYEYLRSEGKVKNGVVFAESVGLKPSMLTEITKGRSNVGLEALQNTVSVYSELNAHWLLTGNGCMINKGHADVNHNASLIPVISPNAGDDVSATVSATVSPIILNKEGAVQIPVTEINVAAGSGHLNPDFVESADYISLPKALTTSGTHLCVRNKGESMAPTILDSSYVIIRLLDRSEWRNMDDEYVYVVTDKEGHSYLKRVKNRFHQGFIVLMSDNPDKAFYSNFNLQESEIFNIWVAEFVISARMPNIHRQYYGRVQELEERMDDMANTLQKLTLK